MATIEIDGKSLDVENGTMIIKAADEAGIYIPRFCYHEKLSIAANCRMCMVDIEKAPKPMPACATPVADGMKISTISERAVEAQKGTMEFLLINHPLDCPICDQGGECPLQDQALGYGKDVSRFTEKKRVVEDKDIGPLIATAMTRCIHCTRCVRFGQEIAGIMEMGGTGRGEHMEITTFLGGSIDSEVSGNMIDLCPVGALTSKPYRYSARSWELQNHDAISPHDCVGANLYVQTLRNEVKRIVPRDNSAVNECWISDRDRFGYEAVNSSERLTQPMLKSGDHWEVTDWKTAFSKVVQGLQTVINAEGPDALAALISPLATNEEGYLFQKLIRSMGSDNVDHRLRQVDFLADTQQNLYSGAELSLEKLSTISSVLLVGSNIRKEQPLLSLKIRAASLSGSKIYAINPLDYCFNFKLDGASIVEPSTMATALASVALEVSRIVGTELPEKFNAWAQLGDNSDVYSDMAEVLVADAADSLIILGDSCRQHPHYSAILAISNWIREVCGVKRIDLHEANGVGLTQNGCVPKKQENNAVNLASNPRSAYLLYGLDCLEDSIYGNALEASLKKADFVVSFSAFKSESMNHADVVLPITPYTECSGHFTNVEGISQRSNAAALPMGEARPGWKVLRVLANQLSVSGFDFIDLNDVNLEMENTNSGKTFEYPHHIEIAMPNKDSDQDSSKLFHRIMDVPIYRVDPLVRRSNALQKTADNSIKPIASLNAEQAREFNLRDGTLMNVVTPEGAGISIEVHADDRVPPNCIYIPAGYAETAPLGIATHLTLEEV